MLYKHIISISSIELSLELYVYINVDRQWKESIKNNGMFDICCLNLNLQMHQWLFDINQERQHNNQSTNVKPYFINNTTILMVQIP